MQGNTITLMVNDDHDDGTTPLVENVYTRFDEYQNRTVYIHEDHTVALRNILGLYRSFPKANGNFRGTAKSAVKMTQDFAVDGVDSETSIIVPGIINVEFSFPLGLTAAQTLEMRMRMVTLMNLDTVMVPLTDQLMV